MDQYLFCPVIPSSAVAQCGARMSPPQKKTKYENKTAVANHRMSIMGILDITLKTSVDQNHLKKKKSVDYANMSESV